MSEPSAHRMKPKFFCLRAMTPTCTPCPSGGAAGSCVDSFVERLSTCTWLLAGLRLSHCGAAVVKHGLLQIGEATNLIESPGVAGVRPILGDCGGVGVGWTGKCAPAVGVASC